MPVLRSPGVNQPSAVRLLSKIPYENNFRGSALFELFAVLEPLVSHRHGATISGPEAARSSFAIPSGVRRARFPATTGETAQRPCGSGFSELGERWHEADRGRGGLRDGP